MEVQMKKLSTFLTLFLGVCLVFSFAAKPSLVPDEVIVKFAQGADMGAIKGKYGLLKKADSWKKGEFVVFKHKNPQAILASLKNEPGVIAAEQNGYCYATMIPNDPYYSYQWHMPRIGMEAAWDINTGSGVIVAINDTGVKQSLEDLADTNFMAGYDFVNLDNDPTDDHGHGSHVCGTVAQSTNNSIGVTGIAYDCTIMPVKVLSSSGGGTWDQVANGVYYAADNGADIINMSLGGTGTSSTLEDACNYAWNNGVLVVCAAGNNGSSTPFYPAAYEVCIAVSATNYIDEKANYSNYGSYVDICAPGGDTNDYNGDGYIDGVLQNTFSGTDEGYYFYYGTSMASPHVSGVAALVKSQEPSRTNADIRNILETTAEDLGASGWDQYFGWGIVDAEAALGSTPPPPKDIYVFDITQTITKKGANYYSTAVITIKDEDGGLVSDATVYITWSGVVGGSDSGTTQNGTVTFTSAKAKKQTGPFTITVDNVTHAVHNYNPDLNVETSDTAYY